MVEILVVSSILQGVFTCFRGLLINGFFVLFHPTVERQVFTKRSRSSLSVVKPPVTIHQTGSMVQRPTEHGPVCRWCTVPCGEALGTRPGFPPPTSPWQGIMFL